MELYFFFADPYEWGRVSIESIHLSPNISIDYSRLRQTTVLVAVVVVVDLLARRLTLTYHYFLLLFYYYYYYYHYYYLMAEVWNNTD